MKAISQRVCFLVIATGFGVLTSVYSFIKDLTMHQLQWDSLLAVAISTTVCLLGFLIYDNQCISGFTNQNGGVIIKNFDKVMKAIEASGIRINKEVRKIEGFSMFM